MSLPTFHITNNQDAEQFKEALTGNKIKYNEKMIDVIQVNVNVEKIMDTNLEELNFDPTNMTIPVISDKAVNRYRFVRR